MGNNEKDAQLRLLYDVTTRELDSYKRQQWQTAYYVLLIYAVVVTTGFHFINSPYGCELIPLSLTILFVLIMAIWALFDLEFGILERRRRLRKDLRPALEAIRRVPKLGEYWAKDWGVFGVLISTVSIGAVFSLWLLYEELKRDWNLDACSLTRTIEITLLVLALLSAILMGVLILMKADISLSLNKSVLLRTVFIGLWLIIIFALWWSLFNCWAIWI